MQKKKIAALVATLIIVMGLFAGYIYSIPFGNASIQAINATVDSDPVDVVFVGSSHIYCSVNPIKLYEDYGYTSLILGGGSRSPWQNYYYIREAIREYKPKLIVLDVYMAGSDLSYLDHSRTVNNLLDYPFSTDKLGAVFASDTNDPIGIILRWPYVHQQYRHIKFFDSPEYKDSYTLGAEILTTIDPYSDYELPLTNGDTNPIQEKNEIYLRKSIEYCLDEDVQILLVNAPCPCIDSGWQKSFSYISLIAGEYDIMFLDGNTPDIYNMLKLDYMVDNYGNGGHLNIGGMNKFTCYLGKEVLPEYNLMDHRSDSSCAHYDKICSDYHDNFDDYIAKYYDSIEGKSADAE